MDSQLINDDEIGKAGHCVVSPLLATFLGKSSKEASQDHDEIGNDSNKNVGTVQAGKESKIEEQEWGGDTPVDVTCPVDFTVQILVGGKAMLGRVGLEDDMVEADAITSGHGEVRDGGEGGDECCQDVEHAFLLLTINLEVR